MITELLLAELDREMVGTRRALERVPEGQNEWKPHEKSMPLGYRSFRPPTTDFSIRTGSC
jgi:hypothetical protein